MSYINADLRKINVDLIETPEDMLLALEIMSTGYKHIFHEHFKIQELVENSTFTTNHMRVDTLAKRIGYNPKTVYRFHADADGLIKRRKRWKNGKQISNVYTMPKPVYRLIKMFTKLGLFKEGVKFKQHLKWIRDLWAKAGYDLTRFMNNIYNYKPFNTKKMQPTYEHTISKMSVGESQKCPSSIHSLFSSLNINGTDWVPSKNLLEIEALLKKKLQQALADAKWYAMQPGNFIRNHAALFGNRLKACL